MIRGSVSLSRGDISRAAHIVYILRTFIFLVGLHAQVIIAQAPEGLVS